MRSAGAQMLRRIPRGITSGYSRVVADNRYLYDPVWNRAVDAAVSGRYVQTGICRSGCKGTVGRILCKHDDCLVFCDSACEAVGYGDSISGRTETGSLGASEDDSESGGELSNHIGAESIFEEFTLSKEIKTGRILKSIKTHRKLQEQREKYNWKMRKRYIEITVE